MKELRQVIACKTKEENLIKKRRDDGHLEKQQDQKPY